jgi:hypothetical protein
MADEFVLPKDIGTIDCSDIQPWDRKSLRYDYILKATTGDEDYPIVPEEVGICTNLWVHGNAQIDNIQINQTITGNPTSYLGDVTAGDINSIDLNVSGISTFKVASSPNLTVNSTLSFELTSNTNLRVYARGADGVIRSHDLTLS